MNRAKKPNLSVAHRNDQIYMELKEIIREKALEYLPAKSLRRFTGVSKDWKLHISSPFFAHSQSNSFQDVSGFFFQTGASVPSFVSLDAAAYGIPDPSLTFLPDKVNIKSSSYGLLCCQGQTGTRPYYICNPATQQWKELPKPEAHHGLDPALVLIFEPSLLNFVVEFKIVCAFPSKHVCGSSDLNICEFDIYSSSKKSWRRSYERVSLRDRKIIPNTGVHAGGIIHWKMTEGAILTFDLKKERGKHSDFGWDGYYCCSDTYFGELNGRLCCARVHQPTLNIELLEYPEFNSIKFKEPVIFGDYLYSLYEDFCCMADVMYVGEKIVVIQFGNAVVLYNLETQDLKELCAAEKNTRLIPYVNSLVEI
ncbi:F-box family protein [Euphorbia peplus]|nr:F-box family protein [Euphorbia peplus]